MTIFGSDRFKIRLNLIKLIMILIWGVFAGRLVVLQIIQRDRFLAAARQQQYHVIELQAKRGTIYDREGRVLAQDIDSYSFYIVPGEIKDKKAAARRLANITGAGGWSAKFADHPRFLWVARKTSADMERRLRDSKIETINHIIEPRRVYPAGDLGLALLGRVDIDGRGLSGMELHYNELLSGKSGRAMLKRDGLGNSYLFDEELLVEPQSGSDLILTLDLDLQQIAEQELAADIIENEAAMGLALFMATNTGELLACAVQDSLGNPDPRNRAVADQYEPGSTFKIITAAAVLDYGLFEPNDSMFVENGTFRIGGRTIRDDHEYDNLSVEDIIVYSSNIGVSKLAQKLGDQRFYKVIKEAGFVTPLGVDFPGEAAGSVQHPQWRDHYLANVSFGHGISATPLQIVSVYAAIANGGSLYRPYIGSQTTDANGMRQALSRPHRIREVFSQDLTRVLEEFLTQVVIRGTGRKAYSEIVPIAGKTGTALKLREDKKGYDHRRARASFVGYFPVENPEVVGLVLFDEPKKSRYGGETTAPTFRKIAERYYCLPHRMAERMLVMENRPNGPEATGAADVSGDFYQVLEASARYYNDSNEMQRIPDFRGLTIKQALKLASIKNVKCDIEGSGIIESQRPAAGAINESDMTILLRCKADELSHQ